ncbi:MAG TPA: hypothetical protein VHQ86_02750 [Candidatus Saccharimonadia bacterium]|nr:hypothetical protein [Candidatus Saccharimonadia bacterium]
MSRVFATQPDTGTIMGYCPQSVELVLVDGQVQWTDDVKSKLQAWGVTITATAGSDGTFQVTAKAASDMATILGFTGPDWRSNTAGEDDGVQQSWTLNSAADTCYVHILVDGES